MDAFEERFARGTGKVYFRDKQPLPRWMLGAAPLSIAAMLAFAFLAASPGLRTPLIAFALIGGTLAFVANLALMGLRMVVSDGGVEVFVGVRRFHYPLEQIASVEREPYRFKDYPFGRGQTKWGPGGRAFVGGLLPNDQQGVALSLTNGKKVLVTTSDPQGLAEAITAALAQSRGGGPRIAADEVDAETLAEAEAEAEAEAARLEGERVQR